MISKLLLYKILQLFSYMVIGYVVCKMNVVRQNDSAVLSKLSLYLFTPAAIIKAFDFDQTDETRAGLFLAFGAAIAVHLVLLLLDRFYAGFVNKSPVERASVMYPNAGNLIIPIVTSVLGGE